MECDFSYVLNKAVVWNVISVMLLNKAVGWNVISAMFLNKAGLYGM